MDPVVYRRFQKVPDLVQIPVLVWQECLIIDRGVNCDLRLDSVNLHVL